MRDKTWTENEYAGVYSRLETFAPKEKHDRELADLVSTLIEKEDIPKEEVTFAELGAGPAPLSKILSDPFENSQEFGMRKILSFLEIDQKTRKEIYNEEKTVPAIIMQYLKDPKMKEIFNRNRKLMQKAALMNERETYELIQKTGVFEEILYTKPNTYLGSNLTMVLRKNGLSIEKDDRKLLGEPIELKGYIHEDILRKIGQFRKKIMQIRIHAQTYPQLINTI